MLDESVEEKSRKKIAKKKMAKRNLSQIVDLVESSKTHPYTPRNSLKKCIFGPVKVSGEQALEKSEKLIFLKQIRPNGVRFLNLQVEKPLPSKFEPNRS